MEHYELWPWKYSIMNKLGMSDGDWGVILILLTMTISFVLGRYVQNEEVSYKLPSLMLGFLSGVANYVFLWGNADQAIGLMITAVIFCPLLCWASYSLGKRLKAYKIKRQQIRLMESEE